MGAVYIARLTGWNGHKIRKVCGLSTYVISDIHGCYEEFLRMLEDINFSDTDSLILAGDFIDRGRHSYEMLKWIEHCPENVHLIRGNHEEEFASYIDLMLRLDKKEGLGTDYCSHKETAALYSSVKYFLKNAGLAGSYFDLYGTINSLVNDAGVTLEDLCRWVEIIRRMPYYRELAVGDRACVVVHAGYAGKLENVESSFPSLEEFYLYAREDSLRLGGKPHGMVVAGHTPTIAKGAFAYNRGKVFRYYDKETDCIFYDIDCGCVFCSKNPDAGLACIRLEDEKIFYIR